MRKLFIFSSLALVGFLPFIASAAPSRYQWHSLCETQEYIQFNGGNLSAAVQATGTCATQKPKILVNMCENVFVVYSATGVNKNYFFQDPDLGWCN